MCNNGESEAWLNEEPSQWNEEEKWNVAIWNVWRNVTLFEERQSKAEGGINAAKAGQLSRKYKLAIALAGWRGVMQWNGLASCTQWRLSGLAWRESQLSWHLWRIAQPKILAGYWQPINAGWRSAGINLNETLWQKASQCVPAKMTIPLAAGRLKISTGSAVAGLGGLWHQKAKLAGGKQPSMAALRPSVAMKSQPMAASSGYRFSGIVMAAASMASIMLISYNNVKEIFKY